MKGNLLNHYRQIINDDALTAYQKYVVNWDAFNPTHLSSTQNTITQEYDALNRIRKAFYPNDRDNTRKVMEPTYNKGGALLSLKMDSTDYVKEVAYNARGQRILIAMGNQIMTRYAYDLKTFRVLRQRSALYTHSGHTYTPNAGIRQDLQYTYDLEGTITSINDAAPANTYAQGPGNLMRLFSHDPLRRLLSATGRETSNVYNQPSWDLNIRPQDYTDTNTYTRTYQYDKIGNIQQLKHVANGHGNQDFIRDFTYDSSHNKLKSFTVNSTTYQNSYNPNGSVIKEGQSRYYEWGANDKLSVFKNQAGTSTPSVYTNYFYNAQGERIKKHTRKGNKITVTFYMDGGMFETSYTKTVGGGIDNNRFYNTIKISDDGALIATIRVGNNVDDGTFAIKYIVGDHLNNSTAVLKTTGSLINREEYYPFGETSFGGFQYKRYRYNGKEKDEESGLYEYGQRYYAPWLCRFVSVDPIAEDFPQLSSYNYAGNKPITHVDIEGLQSSDDSEKKSKPNFKTYTSPSGDTFIASGVHNVASAKGKSEVMTTAGVMVETRTNAVLQFDWGGNNYKAHFSSETLDFTGYKDKDGNAFPIEYSSGQYFADLNITIEEKGDGALAFTAVISGAENWVWNESVFSFDIPIDFNSSQGFSLDNLLGSPTVSKNDTIAGGATGGGGPTPSDFNIPSSISGKSEFTGRLYFDSLDQDLPSLLQGLRVEYIENIINVGKLGSNLDASIGGNFLKATNANFQTVIRATQYTGSLGLQDKSKMSKTERRIGNINPTMYDFKLSSVPIKDFNIYNEPTKMDSLSLGIPLKR